MYYNYDELKEDIFSLEKGIKFHQEFIEDNEKREKEILRMQELLEEKKKLLESISLMDTKTFIDLLKFFLESIDDKVEILLIDNRYEIIAKGKVILSINTSQVNVYELINQDSMQDYPSIKEAFMKYLDKVTYYMFSEFHKVEDFDYIFFIKNYFILKNNSKFIKPYKINVFMRKILLSIDILSSLMYKERDKENLDLYYRLLDGEYNDLEKQDSFITTKINFDELKSYDQIRKKEEKNNQHISNINMENYVVFICLNNIFKLIGYIIDGNGRYISINGLHQTPPTQEELEKINDLKKEVFHTNYSWREARDIHRNYYRLNIYENSNFPHNVEEIIAAFRPKVNTFFNQIKEDINLEYNLDEVKNRADYMLGKITSEGIFELLMEPSNDYIDEYLRRMILSLIDFEYLIDNNNILYPEDLQKIRGEFINGTTISVDTLALLINNKNKKEITNLAIGVLKTFIDDKKITNMLNTCIDIQKSLNCYEGYVYYNDVNSLTLPNKEVLYSTYYEDIEGEYASYQRQFDYYFEHASDIEYIEGCIEIIGNIMFSQIFRKGNKRTAKCLFNRMMIARNIIPPILDFNENTQEVFDEFAVGRFNRFEKIRYKAILQCVDVFHKFNENYFKEPLQFSIEDVDRSFRY